MAEEVKIYLNQPEYDKIIEEADKPDKSVSSVGRKHIENSLNADTTNDDPSWFQRALGQSLFVSGAVVGVYDAITIAVGLLLFGLGLMLQTEMQAHRANGHSTWESFKRTLGV
jgi:hypothetical protein